MFHNFLLVHYNVVSAEFPTCSDQDTLPSFLMLLVLQAKEELKFLALLVLITCNNLNAFRVETSVALEKIIQFERKILKILHFANCDRFLRLVVEERKQITEALMKTITLLK